MHFGCSQFKSITLPSTLTTIGLGAFESTGLTGITIPSDVKTIKEGAFGGTGLTSVTIPDKVETLGQGVFENCTQLTSINIPKSVKSMGILMFDGCTALTCITFEPGSQLTEVASSSPWELFTGTSSELKVYCEPDLKSKLSGRGVPDERIITTVDVTLVDGDTITPKKLTTAQTLRHLTKTNLSNRVTPLQVGIPMQTARSHIRMHSCLQTSRAPRSMPVGLALT